MKQRVVRALAIDGMVGISNGVQMKLMHIANTSKVTALYSKHLKSPKYHQGLIDILLIKLVRSDVFSFLLYRSLFILFLMSICVTFLLTSVDISKIYLKPDLR